MKITKVILLIYGLILIVGKAYAAEVAVIPSTQIITPRATFKMKNISDELKGFLPICMLLIISMISVLPAAAIGSNVAYIQDNITAPHGNNITVPIMIYNSTGVGSVGLTLNYNASIVNVTGATQGDFTGGFFGFDSANAANGWVTINAFVIGTQLTGNVTVANVKLEAVGNPDEQSALNLEIIAMVDRNAIDLSYSIDNGSFIVTSLPPVIDPIGTKSVNEGSLLGFTINATDPDGDVLTYSAINLPQGAVFNTNTRAFSWTPSYTQAGSYPNVQFRVSDGSLNDTENITITVNNVNRIPAISVLANQSGNIGVPWTYNISSFVSDPDGNPLTVTTNDGNISVSGFVLTFSYSVVVSNKSVLITVSDGSLSASRTIFVTAVENSPPLLANPTSSQIIPDDTDSVPLWGETSKLNITVTDNSGISSVIINLSAIGGSSATPMVNLGGNIWSVTANASAGTTPNTHYLQVNATDVFGNSNTSFIPLVVMRNGDANGNGVVNIADAMLLGNYISYPGQYTISNAYVAEVTGEGSMNIADAMLIANMVSFPGQGYILR